MSGGWVFRFSILKSISKVIVQNHTVHCWNPSKSINYFHLWWGEPAFTTSRSIPVFRNFLHISWKENVHWKREQSPWYSIVARYNKCKGQWIQLALLYSIGNPPQPTKSLPLWWNFWLAASFFLFGTEQLESQSNRSPCRSCNWFNKQWIYFTPTCPKRAATVACHPSQMIIETNWPTQST